MRFGSPYTPGAGMMPPYLGLEGIKCWIMQRSL